MTSSYTRKAQRHRRLLSCALFAFATSFTDAQTVTGAGAYTQVNGKFYVHGGEHGHAILSGDLYSLDLTKSWTTSAPAWSQLKSSPFANSYHTATHHPNNDVIYFLGRNIDLSNKAPPTSFFNAYSIANDAWYTTPIPDTTVIPTPLIGDASDRRDFQGAYDPERGIYVVVGGNNSKGNVNFQTIVHMKKDSSTTFKDAILGPGSFATEIQGAAIAWLRITPRRKGALISLGGNNIFGTVPFNTFPEYNATTDIWNLFITTQLATTLPNADATTVFIYGGWSHPVKGRPLALNELWILDGATMVWKQGASPIGGNVGYAACTVASNKLIVWGGFQYLNSTPPTVNPMMIYDIATDKWITRYDPSPEYLALAKQPSQPQPQPKAPKNVPEPASPPVEQGDGEETSNKPGLGAIVGGALAGVVTLAAILGFTFYRRRRNNKYPQRCNDKPTSFFGGRRDGYRKHEHMSKDFLPFPGENPNANSCDSGNNVALHPLKWPSFSRVLPDASSKSSLPCKPEPASTRRQQSLRTSPKSPELAMLEAEERASSSPGATHRYVDSSQRVSTYYQPNAKTVPVSPKSHRTGRGPQGLYEDTYPMTGAFSESIYKYEIPQAAKSGSTLTPTMSSNTAHTLSSPTSEGSITFQPHHTSQGNMTDLQHRQGHTDEDEAATSIAHAHIIQPTTSVARVVRNPQRHPTIVAQHSNSTFTMAYSHYDNA
ncbi:hypothetical protein BGZ94_007642 [Podila epigama]|nr:hypothetical protein BGZ94_007642 [Podila epigama]